MSPEIDLRDVPDDDRRARLFEAVADTDPGDGIEVVADEDPDGHLVRYQIERDRALGWEHARPDGVPREVYVTVGDSLDEAEFGTIDVRDLKPQRRHAALLDVFDELDAGDGFVLVNDHDPKPLYHELRSMYGDVVDWEYESRGSDGWRVRVTKTDASEAGAEDVVTRYDVREIPEPERHPTIHHRYGMIPEGGTMELVAPHEPRPLRREFDQQYGDSFSWEVVESKPNHCRVWITKRASGGAAEVGGSELGDSRDCGGTTDEEENSGAAQSGGVDAAPAPDETIETVEELDVRDLPPAQRHKQIFDAYDDLAGGTGFVLVNDHDPKPLYHQFEAEAGPSFRWEYRQRDLGEFRVLIGKAETDGTRGHEEEPESPF